MGTETRLVLAVLATYRLAQLLSFEAGPFNVFGKIRHWLVDQSIRSIKSRKQTAHKIWNTLAQGAECPYCCGVWFAAVTAGMALWGEWLTVPLAWLAIAGGQCLLQEFMEGNRGRE
jgi:hypothetical protein